MGERERVLREATATLAAAVAVLLPAAPAQARVHACPQVATAARVSAEQPAEDRMFAPDRLAPFATGAGIRVAVIDSGVDPNHPQLRGQVAAGRDFLHDNPDGRQDCVGHGTAVAGIIAAKPAAGAGPRGLAPEATIVPIRVSERPDTQQPEREPSGTDQSGTGQSGTGQSGTGQSGTGQSGTGQSGTGQSGTGQSGTGQSGTGQTDPERSDTEQADTEPPGLGQTGSEQSDTEQSGPGQPGTEPAESEQSEQSDTEEPGVWQPEPERSGTGQSGSGQSGSGRDGSGREGDQPVSPARFAAAIDWAVAEGGVDVINLSLVMTEDDARVRAAVARAVAAGVVVVAAVGNHGRAGEANPAPYPASYPDVLGVGAIGPNGMAADFSQHGDYVDVLAPGVGVTVAVRGSGHASATGTSYATPFAAATAALVKQRFPALIPAQVIRRILATADPAPGGGDARYGFGVLNPYRALTETLAPAVRPAPVPVASRSGDPGAAAVAARRARAQTRSLAVAAIGAAAIVLILAITATTRRGRRRGWRPPDPAGPGTD